MQIEKTNEEITSIRKTTRTDFTLTNDKGESKEIEISYFTQDDEQMGYDNDKTIWNTTDKEEITDWEAFCFDFFGESCDPDDIDDQLTDLITI